MWGQVNDRVKQQIHTSPPIPLGFSVTSEIFGVTVVTKHAWDQFCHRYLRGTNQLDESGKYAASFFAKRFCECFSRAKEAPLPIPHAVMRTIKNKFQPTRYFMDPYVNLRFVIVGEKGSRETPRILTVEIPYCQG
jgi:hypothetical protein